MAIKNEKSKTKWVCQNCGYETSKYLGKCPDCGSWGSIAEEVELSVKSVVKKVDIRDSEPSLIDEIEIDSSIRFTTGLDEFDRVLGGGLVQGSLTLLAGDPGIGKSTLLLQAGSNISNSGKKLLYVTAEESSSQVKLRAKRLNVSSQNLYIYAQNNFELIKKHIAEMNPEIVVIDSIQAIYSNEISSTSGSVSQIRECTNLLMDLSKSQNITIIIIGHVTKDGNIAGPKVLEHMVDSVIYFEGDKFKSYRILRCMKNRFGTTNEVGLFNMCENGLKQVNNPSELFLNQSETNTPGSVIIATNEGTRPLLVEIQALVGTTSYPMGRRVSNGIDFNRLLQIIAVIEKRLGINLSKQDVYVNVIGGIDINEPAADLGVALSIITCARDVVVDFNTVIIGEIGLSGEIRPVNNIEKRIIEAQKLGFKKIIIPEQLVKSDILKYENIEIVQVKRLLDAISSCINKIE